MDLGHHNCRDYYINPPIESLLTTPVLSRHESWSELEQRSRSPASFRPKFPLLALPLELRQHILRYVLPYTTELRGSSPLTAHARNFRAVKARNLAPAAPLTSSPTANVVWHKGNTSVFAVCRRLHSECADLVYGGSTFILFVSFSGISIRFRYLLSTGVVPTTRRDNFLDWIPAQYLALMRRFVVHVDHVDQYTGQIKFNVGGTGLVYGLQRQIQKLVDALPSGPSEPRLTSMTIHISNGTSVTDAIKSDLERRCEGPRVAPALEEMLAPFQQMRGVRHVSVHGAITPQFAAKLQATMSSTIPAPVRDCPRKTWDGGMQDPPPGVHICVYGNDL